MKKLVLIILMAAFVIPIFGLDLIVRANEMIILNEGVYKYDNVVMGNNSTIGYRGNVKILIKNLQVDTLAQIVYIKGSDNAPNKYLDLIISNGSGIKGSLFIVGNGRDGTNGTNGDDGQNGGDEHNGVRIEIRKKLGVPYPYPVAWHTDPTPGGNGSPGTNGANGENGVNISASLFDLSSESVIYINSNGGNGGAGGDGGKGGNGGSGKLFDRATNGGNGGAGGNGGNGGNAGQIGANLVYLANVTNERLDFLKKLLDTNIIALPGLGGLGGISGSGGANGEGGPGTNIVRVDGVITIKKGAGYGGDVGQNGLEGSRGGNSVPEKQLIPATQWLKEQATVLDALLK